MMNSKVFVIRNGAPLSGAKVALHFGGFFSTHTSRVLTDRNGCASIDHASKASANVYVNGKKCGKFSAPGSISINL